MLHITSAADITIRILRSQISKLGSVSQKQINFSNVIKITLDNSKG